jgi:hypothetical protein
MVAAITEAIERMFADLSTPGLVREVEKGAPAAPLWAEIDQNGFADALLPADQGGSGVTLADLSGLLLACGRHALPVPLGPTILARAVLARAGRPIPEGPIALADGVSGNAAGGVVCRRVAFGRTAEWVLLALDGAAALVEVAKMDLEPAPGEGSLQADLAHSSPLPASACFEPGFEPDFEFGTLGACLFAAHLAGAMERILASTVQYAKERIQFGRPIGKFQAIQQQISVMAEQVFAARMAAEMGCAGGGAFPRPDLAALAKARTSEAAVPVAAIAHAVHGAMGISEEVDLQLYTRRLYEWRMNFGSESYWHARIGERLLEDGEAGSLSFARRLLTPDDAKSKGSAVHGG